ncbi:hypothetical protein BZY95_13750 [Billgrantia desiderata SP1]|uniref:DndE family protein n=1 Tax=Billgrantia desiderata TaxID=52021 RepID=UPI000A376456|nr:DndE family protein [Halomonas desiderata]OUE40775.1 hypothetical protein BZY95_13750 [Halomonas desiderata SP1]
MLPNRFSLTQQTEEKLKRDKLRHGIPPNILARELFFKSIEQGVIVDPGKEILFGKMMLEKTVWLGDLEKITEAVIRHRYGKVQKHEAAKIWSLHIQAAL